MRKKKTTQGNLGIAAGFSFIVLGLILFSFILRVLMLLGESKFDGVNSFTVVFDQAKVEQVVNFSPKTQSISILNVKDREGQNLGTSLEIPVDGSFVGEEIVNGKNLSTVLSGNILNFEAQKELNFMDFLRLFLFTNTVKQNAVNEETISKESDTQEVSRVTSSFFVDPVILEEKQSIEVVNATDVPGLGNKLANLITNMGGNVILVSTEDKIGKSEILYVKKNYTAQRLAKILGFKFTETKKKSIPDVIIVIGEDALKNLKF